MTSAANTPGRQLECVAPFDATAATTIATTATAAAFVSYYEPDPRRDTAHLVPKIEAPVLILAGTEDTVVPGVEEAMAPLAEADAVSLAVVDGADHMFRDLYWYDVADAVEAFLSARE